MIAPTAGAARRETARAIVPRALIIANDGALRLQARLCLDHLGFHVVEAAGLTRDVLALGAFDVVMIGPERSGTRRQLAPRNRCCVTERPPIMGLSAGGLREGVGEWLTARIPIPFCLADVRGVVGQWVRRAPSPIYLT